MAAKDLTALLKEWTAGNPQAGDQLLPLVYGELRQVARKYLQAERPDHTLQATALVHEAYLRLAGNAAIDWQNRAQFFAIAAREMRRILVDHARSRNAGKRGAGARKVSLDIALEIAAEERDEELLDLDRALDGLAALDPQKARIVELRYFGGLTVEESAAVLGVSTATVDRKWSLSKAWLYRELAGKSGGASAGSRSHDA